jgi:hypothetical protein
MHVCMNVWARDRDRADRGDAARSDLNVLQLVNQNGDGLAVKQRGTIPVGAHAPSSRTSAV